MLKIQIINQIILTYIIFFNDPFIIIDDREEVSSYIKPNIKNIIGLTSPWESITKIKVYNLK